MSITFACGRNTSSFIKVHQRGAARQELRGRIGLALPRVSRSKLRAAWIDIACAFIGERRASAGRHLAMRACLIAATIFG